MCIIIIIMKYYNWKVVKSLYFKLYFIPVPLLQSLVSHDPSEIILIYWFAQEIFLIIINVENSCAA